MYSEVYLKVISGMGMHLMPSGRLSEGIKKTYEEDEKIYDHFLDKDKRLQIEIFCNKKPCWDVNNDYYKLFEDAQRTYGIKNFMGAEKGSIFHVIIKGKRCREALNFLLDDGIDISYLQPLFPY